MRRPSASKGDVPAAFGTQRAYRPYGGVVTNGALGRDEYLRRWSELHGGHDPRGSRLTLGWLTIAHAVARPLAAARVSPDLITVIGLAIAALAAWFASLGGRWCVVAAAVVVVSALSDSLDGAVAVMTARTSRWGQVLDAVVDRLGDAIFLLALWLVGAPAGVCVGAGVVMMLHEYARARAAAAGMSEVGVITIWERPTRVVVTAMFLLGAGIYTDSAARWAAAGAWAWLTLGVIGLVQLLVVIRRRLGVQES